MLGTPKVGFCLSGFVVYHRVVVVLLCALWDSARGSLMFFSWCLTGCQLLVRSSKCRGHRDLGKGESELRERSEKFLKR